MESKVIKKYIENKFPCQVGFIKARIFSELKNNLDYSINNNLYSNLVTNNVDIRLDPFKIYENVQTIIVVIFPYANADYNLNNKNHLLSRSSWGIDYHLVIKDKLKSIQEYLKEHYNSDSLVLCDNHNLHDKYLAYLAGLGNFGKNTLLINEKYGSYFFISLILTNLKLSNDEYNKPNVQNICASCNRCVKACPTNAISESRFIDAKRCLSYLTQSKKKIPTEFLDKFKKFTFGCDFCQIACVYNNDKENEILPEFKPTGNEIITVNSIYNLSNKAFIQKYQAKAASFRGKNVLLRNAILISANINNIDDLNHLAEIEIGETEYLEQAIDYAKKIVHKGDN